VSQARMVPPASPAGRLLRYQSCPLPNTRAAQRRRPQRYGSRRTSASGRASRQSAAIGRQTTSGSGSMHAAPNRAAGDVRSAPSGRRTPTVGACAHPATLGWSPGAPISACEWSDPICAGRASGGPRPMCAARVRRGRCAKWAQPVSRRAQPVDKRGRRALTVVPAAWLEHAAFALRGGALPFELSRRYESPPGPLRVRAPAPESTR
jgi:hypothetical protein